MEVELVTD